MTTVFRVRKDFSTKGEPLFIERFRVLSGPDEDGRYEVKSRQSGVLRIHGDWLSPTTVAAIDAGERRERQRHSEEMAKLAALREGSQKP